jgi:hypothetical protein
MGKYCRSGFATLPMVSLQEQPAVVLLLDGALVSWSLAMDERDEHEDLRGSGRRSVIPYSHGRTELYCAQACMPAPFHFSTASLDRLIFSRPLRRGVYPGLL